MDKKTEALKLALEALEIERNVPRLGPVPTKTSKAITALREALASEAKEQPAQPSKPWVGLTDVEIASACKKHGGAEWWWRDIEEYGRAIEAKLREKNA